MSEKRSEKSEASGLLMSIVRTLTSSSDVNQREQERVRLDKAFRESDRRLDGLVSQHLNDLTSIMQAFNKISTRITTSQDKVKGIRESLLNCKNLLHCKRDELRRLWVEGIESKTICSMIDKIEKIKDAGDRVRIHMDKRQYLTCTQIITESLNDLDSDLAEVDALADVKRDLITKKNELFDTLVEELNKQIYVRWMGSIVHSLNRQGSSRQSTRMEYARLQLKLNKDKQIEKEEKMLQMIMQADLPTIAKATTIHEGQEGDGGEENPVTYLCVLIEALATLRRIPDSIDYLRSHLRPGLVAIIQRTSRQVCDLAYIDGEDLSQLPQPQLFLDLLIATFAQFKVVAHLHNIIIANFTRIKNSMQSLGDFQIYNSVEVWNKMQTMLQMLLTDYLDLRNFNLMQSPHLAASHDDNYLDLSLYFGKKKQNRPKKSSLFRFDDSSHSISMSSYMREQRQELLNLDNILTDQSVPDSISFTFVCRPNPTNITVVYNPLQAFLKEIEKATNSKPGSLALQGFVKEFIEKTFLLQIQYQTETKVMDNGRTLIDQHTQATLNLAKPLLKSTVTVANHIQHLCGLMRSLPDYSSQFLNLISKVLQDYLGVCNSIFLEYTNPDVEDKIIISSNWAKDDDINRFLRSLPNWKNLKSNVSTPTSFLPGDTDDLDDEEMSETDLRAMNLKESNVLTANLSTQSVTIKNIIQDSAHLRVLANLCESLEWFSARIEIFASTLNSATHPYMLSPLPPIPVSAATCISLVTDIDINVATRLPIATESMVMTLISKARHFEELSETCLMILHLEVRLHCFYNLQQIDRFDYFSSMDKLEPDDNVVKLNKDLNVIDGVIRQSLQTKKFRYVFDSLGHLVSTILINFAQFLKKINENGIKKMCRNIFALQQCLANITLNRESDLDYARSFYELLHHSPDDILKRLVDGGRQYEEKDYTFLLQLIHRSSASPISASQADAELAKTISRLKLILAEVGN